MTSPSLIPINDQIEGWLVTGAMLTAIWCVVSWILSRRPLRVAGRLIWVPASRLEWRFIVLAGPWSATILYGHALDGLHHFWPAGDSRNDPGMVAGLSYVALMALVVLPAIGLRKWWRGRNQPTAMPRRKLPWFGPFDPDANSEPPT